MVPTSGMPSGGPHTFAPGAGLGPFGAPVKIGVVSGPGQEDDPTLSDDLLLIVWDGGGDLWQSTRADTGAQWGTPQILSVVNSSSGETTPELSPGGLTLFFGSGRPGGLGGGDIYVSTRSTRTSPWGSPTWEPELSSSGEDTTPTPMPDGLTMTLSSTRAGTWDLYRATRMSAGGVWSTPTPVTELNTSAVDSEPWIDPSDMVIYFSSDRAGGAGGRDIWTASRPAPGAPFGPATLVTDASTPSEEQDPWLTADQRVLIFASDRAGTWDLSMATR
jgi:Tol biopolymer transport system component